MGNGENEEAVAVVRNTGEGVVPGGECGHETKETTGLDDGRVGLILRVAVEVTNTQQQETKVEEEEQQEESHCGSQGAEEQNGGENEPSLSTVSMRFMHSSAMRTYHEEYSEGVVEF